MSSDEAVEFDGIVDRVAAAATEVAATESRVTMRREGTFGVLPAEIATPLVMVLNELLLNAVEHGFAGAADRGGDGGGRPAHRFRRQLHVTRGRQRARACRTGFDARRRASGSACRSCGRWPPASCAARIELRNRAERRHRGGAGRPARQAVTRWVVGGDRAQRCDRRHTPGIVDRTGRAVA